MKRTCVQCGKEFELTKSELDFYRRKKLAFPKRCKECREQNRKMKAANGGRAADTGKTFGQGEGKAAEDRPIQKTDEGKTVHSQSGEACSGSSIRAKQDAASGKTGRILLAVAGVVVVLVIAAAVFFL